MKSMVPWNMLRAKKMPITREKEYPTFSTLENEMNRLFEEHFKGMRFFEPVSEVEISPFTPKIDVKETATEIVVLAELPGIKEENIDVSLIGGLLILKGEKVEEKEEDLKGFYRMERRFGSFERAIPMPCEIKVNEIEASFAHGELKIVLPKVQHTEEVEKKITVKSI